MTTDPIQAPLAEEPGQGLHWVRLPGGGWQGYDADEDVARVLPDGDGRFHVRHREHGRRSPHSPFHRLRCETFADAGSARRAADAEWDRHVQEAFDPLTLYPTLVDDSRPPGRR